MPLYEQIAAWIMEQIKSGEWNTGDMIPSEKELCDQFNVSRPTVRAALSSLTNDGYLVKRKGKGSFVSKPRIIEDSTIFIESFSSEMAAKGMQIQTEVLEHRVVEADETVAKELGLAPGDEVIKLARLRYVKGSFDEGPIVYNISYLPGRFAFLQKCDFENESLTSALKRNHVERKHLEKSINAVLIEGRIARILGVPENSLGILISAVCRSEDPEQVVEYTLSYYPSERNSFILKIGV